MTDPQVLHRLVAEVRRQVRRARAEFFGMRGLFVGALVGSVPLVFRESLGGLAFYGAAACLVVGAGAGALFGYLRRVTPGEAARLADRGWGLQDRVATALEWGEHPDRTPLVAALVADATVHATGCAPRRVVPRLRPREAKLVPVPLALGLVLALAPPIPLPKAGLPNFSASTGEEEDGPSQRSGPLQSAQRPRAPRPDPVARAEMQEHTFVPRQGGTGPSQPGDLSAVFKDTSIGSHSPDFNMFLKKGDERLRLLDQVDRLPDLQKDFTNSDRYRVVFQRARALKGGLRPDQLSPEKLRELLEEMRRLGSKDGGQWGGDIGEGMEALDGGQTDRALEAMERALSKMRTMEERGRDGKMLRGGRDGQGRGGQRGRERGTGGGGPGEEGDFPEGEGLYAGKGKSGSPKGDATARLRGNPFDVGVEGEARAGRKEAFETNLLGRGANLPSRLQYLGVLGHYRKMMEEQVAREQVPRDYQAQVKQYFQSLDEK